MALDKTNLVTFKRGLEASLASASIVKDAFYLTTDTHKLFIGLDDGKTALLNSAIKVYDLLSDLKADSQYKPAKGDMAYIENYMAEVEVDGVVSEVKKPLNALVLNIDGTAAGWTQINYSDAEVRSLIAANATAIANTNAIAETAMPKAGGTFTNEVLGVTPDKENGNAKALVTKEYVDNAVTGLEIGAYATTEYVNGKVSELDGKIATTDTKATNAGSLAAQADGKADVNAATIGALDKETMGATVVEYIGKVKATADAAAVKTVVDDQISGLDTKIGNVDSKADGIAEDLAELTEAAMPKAGGNFTGDVTIKGVTAATTADVATAKAEVIGEGATLTTLKAIEDKHAADLATISSKFDTIQGNVDSLANVMTFVGVTAEEITDTTTTVTIDDKTYTPDTGDVVIDKNGEEFVWDGSKWNQFGSASATTAMIAALEQSISDNADAIDANAGEIEKLIAADVTINSRIDSVSGIANAAATKAEFDGYVASNDAALKVVADKVNHETTGLAATYTLASNAATQTALSNEVTARENAINEIVDQLTWGSF